MGLNRCVPNLFQKKKSRSSDLLYVIDPVDGQGRNRTADTVIFSHLLYQLSYLARWESMRTAGRRN